MERSLFLAQLLGPVLLVLGIALIANRQAFRSLAEEFLQSGALIFLSGLLALVPGLAIVLLHNVWVFDWRVLITVFGWLSTIGGALRILAPRLVRGVGMRMLSRSYGLQAGGVVMAILGIALSFFGYVAGQPVAP